MQGSPSWAAGTLLILPEVQAQFKDIPMDERHQQNTWTFPRALQKAEHTNKHIISDLRRHRNTHQTTAQAVNELTKPQDLGLWRMRQARATYLSFCQDLLLSSGRAAALLRPTIHFSGHLLMPGAMNATAAGPNPPHALSHRRWSKSSQQACHKSTSRAAEHY